MYPKFQRCKAVEIFCAGYCSTRISPNAPCYAISPLLESWHYAWFEMPHGEFPSSSNHNIMYDSRWPSQLLSFLELCFVHNSRWHTFWTVSLLGLCLVYNSRWPPWLPCLSSCESSWPPWRTSFPSLGSCLCMIRDDHQGIVLLWIYIQVFLNGASFRPYSFPFSSDHALSMIRDACHHNVPFPRIMPCAWSEMPAIQMFLLPRTIPFPWFEMVPGRWLQNFPSFIALASRNWVLEEGQQWRIKFSFLFPFCFKRNW